MTYFKTKNRNLGIYQTNLQWKMLIGLLYSHLEYFVVICYIYGYLVYFSRFGMLFQEESGNPGAFFNFWSTHKTSQITQTKILEMCSGHLKMLF
jgi:hypothetical protein